MSTFQFDAALESQIIEIAGFASLHNRQVMSAYNTDFVYYKTNAPINKVLGVPPPPMAVEPDLWEFDMNKVRQIITDYNGEIKDGNSPGEMNLSAALIVTKYIAPIAPVAVVIAQPDNPLGVSMGRGKRAPAPGDVLPIGHVYPDASGDAWIKTWDDTPFGSVTTWQRQ